MQVARRIFDGNHEGRALLFGEGRRKIGGSARRETERDNRATIRTVSESVRGSFGDDQSVRHHGDTVGQILGLVHVMGGEQDRRAERSKPIDQLPGLPARRRVESGRRLIQEEQLGLADDAQRQVDATALTARQRLDSSVGLLLQSDDLNDPIDQNTPREHRGEQFYGLPNSELLVHPGRLENHTNPLPKISACRRRIFTEDGHLAGGATPVTFEDLDGGGLARSVRPE